jgi:WD40 repeat protein
MGGTLLMSLNMDSMVNAVAFSSDGSRIVSGSDDRSVRVWDALTGGEKHVLNGHTDSVRSVAFSSDGSRIVSGSGDKSVRVWGMSMQDRVSRYTREKIAKPTHHLEFTGWLLSPRGGEYIMFVPPGEMLPDDANILTIPHSSIAHVDFTKSKLGPEWASCYSQ